MRNRALSFVFVMAVCAAALAQSGSTQPGKVERIGAFSEKDVSEKMVAAVEEKGYRVMLGDAATAEIWLAKNATAVDSKSGDTSAVFPQLGQGAFIGVIRFIVPAKDFRGQEIKPATYSMRYDRLPKDGNHMGAAAQPDFVLLAPVSDDFDPSKAMPERVMVNLGKRTTGTAHPAVFSLVPTDSVKELPSVFRNNDGFDGFAAKINIGGKEMPFAIVLKGQAAQ